MTALFATIAVSIAARKRNNDGQEKRMAGLHGQEGCGLRNSSPPT